MGVCFLNDDQTRKNKENDNKEISILEETKNDNQILNEQNQKNDFIKNRLSERTIFADIYKEYVITDNILGKGATGIVREGRDKEGKKVAIKSVWKSDIEKNECFKKEIDISLDVQHDSIVKCIDVYEDNTSLHFVLEEINGGDLFDHIIHSEGRKLKEPEAMNILNQILEGLHYLHDEKGIVHRDIKPENFLLYNDGIKVRIKLIDFGFATYCKNEETMNDLLGTPQYAAPEIFEQKPYTSKVDMWSLGVVLYNMVKGTQPFNSREIENIKDMVLHKKVNYDGFKNNKLKNLCEGLLERDPNNRFSSFQALKELKEIIGTNKDEETISQKFKPEMDKMILILYNVKSFKRELLNIYLEECSLETITIMFKEILSMNKTENSKYFDEISMNRFEIYMEAGKLIEFTQNFKHSPENLKKRLKNLCEQKVVKTMEKQIIKINEFFTSIIESIKILRKRRFEFEFKKLDKNNVGWITVQQMYNYFIDPMKRHNIKTKINPDDKIDFEKLYKIFLEYERIKNN